MLKFLRQHFEGYYKHSAKDIILENWDNLENVYNDFESRITTLEN